MSRLLVVFFLLFLILFGAYLLLELVPSEMFGGVDRVRIVSERLAKVSGETWSFTKPIL